jgi:hypothetical protein
MHESFQKIPEPEFMAETWKEIPNFPNYKVSNWGNVRNIRTHRALKCGICKRNPYPFVVIYNIEQRRVVYVHQLIMEVFSMESPCCPTCSGKKEINHKDTDSTNNHLENLEYVTHVQNLSNKVSKKKQSERMQQYYKGSPLKASKNK